LSIQKKLLTIYTVIFMTAFVAFTLIIYVLPERQIHSRVDAELEELASEILRLRRGRGFITVPNSNGILPQRNNASGMTTLETATTFIAIVNTHGQVVYKSQTLAHINNKALDPNLPVTEARFESIHHDDTLMRVLTIPVPDPMREDEPYLFLQVGRLMDTLEDFSSVLVTALLWSGLAALFSVLIAASLTPTMFRPLEDIARTARQITRADDLSRRVPHAHRQDEVGELARAFNQTLERLERLFQTQQRLLADVSHELRTPLTAIRGNVDLMQHFGQADPDSLAAMQDDIERMSRLVQDLLLLARADSGANPLELKPVELDNILFDVYRQAERLTDSVNVKLSVVDQVCVRGDTDRLKQLVLNLVDNSLKYTPVGGEVIIALEKNNRWARISVSDTGIGIAPEHLPHIFERFYRIDKARTRVQGGSGLGLSIARWIAQGHGGNITVTSESGKGSTFTIVLPVHEPESSAAAEENSEAASAKSSRSSYSAAAMRLLGGSGRQK